MRKHLFWSGALLLLLAGCAAPPPVVRYIYPLPPEQPRIEWLGTYASQDDFPKSGAQIAWEKTAGKPELEKFIGPYGIAADGAGKVFVVDLYARNIRVYDFNLRKIKFLLDEPILERPYYLSIDSKKQLYVADAGQKKVLAISPQGKLVKTYGSKEELVNPVYVKVDEARRRLYVSDTRGGQIVVYDLDGGQKLFAFGKGQLLGAQGVAVGPDGNLYVADTLNAKIKVYDAEGQLLRQFGDRLDAEYGLESPKDLAFDSDGNLWLVDYRKQMLRVFGPDGSFLFTAGGSVMHKMGFATPTAIYISPEDEIYVSDLIGKRFSHWRYLSKAALARHPLTEADLDLIRKTTGGGAVAK